MHTKLKHEAFWKQGPPDYAFDSDATRERSLIRITGVA